MREEESSDEQNQQPQEDRDSIWSIPLSRRALYFGLFTGYALAGIGFLLWYEIFEHTADTWPETVLSITQGIGVTIVGAAGLALLTIEGPRTVMVIGDYLKKRLIEPLEERRRLEAQRLRDQARAEGLAEGHTEGLAEGRTEGLAEGRTEGLAEGRTEGLAQGLAEGEARRQAEWVAWNERRLAAGARGEPFDEPPPDLPEEPDQTEDEE